MTAATKNRDLAARLNAARVDLVAEEERRVEERARIVREAAESIDPAITAAAGVLKMPAREILSVEETQIGIVIETHGRTQFVVVAHDRPDADGNWGLMQLTPSTYSPFRQYAHQPTVKPTPPPAQKKLAAAEELAAEAAELAPPMDDDATLAMYEADLARAKAALEVETEFGRRSLLEAQIVGLKAVTHSRRAAVQERQHRENPRPPDPAAVRRNTAVYEWAKTMLDPVLSERQRQHAFARLLQTEPNLAGMPGGEAWAKVELDGAVSFFRHHGLALPDEDDGPEAA